MLGQAGTSILYSNGRLNSSAQSGGRFTLGYWLDPCLCDGVEVTYLMTAQQSDSFSASSDDYSIFARPFFNTVDGEEDARLIAYPGLVEGRTDVTAITDFQGTEVLFRRSMARYCWSEFDLLVGYRWAQLEDNLLIEESTDSLSGATAGTTFDLFDEFDTRNNFHGAELGLRIRRQITPCWSVELLGKIALGNVNSAAAAVGGTLATDATGGTSLSEGGLLAQPTNIGRYEQNRFATISEVGLVLRREFHCGLHATVGYTFIHLSDVARAGNQIDPYINVSQIPPNTLSGMPRPEFSFATTDFWAQGLSLGLEYTF